MNEIYPIREVLKFYTVPLDKINSGDNTVVIKNLDKSKVSCEFNSLEVGLFR